MSMGLDIIEAIEFCIDVLGSHLHSKVFGTSAKLDDRCYNSSFSQGSVSVCLPMI